MSDDEEEPLSEAAERRAADLAPEARDLEAELRERNDAPDGDDLSEVDGDTAAAFWAAVFYVNVGVLLLAVGPILYVDRGYTLVALALVAGGAGLLLRAYFVYRNFRAENEGDDAEGSDDDAENDPDDDSEADGHDNAAADGDDPAADAEADDD